MKRIAACLLSFSLLLEPLHASVSSFTPFRSSGPSALFLDQALSSRYALARNAPGGVRKTLILSLAALMVINAHSAPLMGQSRIPPQYPTATAPKPATTTTAPAQTAPKPAPKTTPKPAPKPAAPKPPTPAELANTATVELQALATLTQNLSMKLTSFEQVLREGFTKFQSLAPIDADITADQPQTALDLFQALVVALSDDQVEKAHPQIKELLITIRMSRGTLKEDYKRLGTQVDKTKDALEKVDPDPKKTPTYSVLKSYWENTSSSAKDIVARHSKLLVPDSTSLRGQTGNADAPRLQLLNLPNWSFIGTPLKDPVIIVLQSEYKVLKTDAGTYELYLEQNPKYYGFGTTPSHPFSPKPILTKIGTFPTLADLQKLVSSSNLAAEVEKRGGDPMAYADPSVPGVRTSVSAAASANNPATVAAPTPASATPQDGSARQSLSRQIVEIMNSVLGITLTSPLSLRQAVEAKANAIAAEKLPAEGPIPTALTDTINRLKGDPTLLEVKPDLNESRLDALGRAIGNQLGNSTVAAPAASPTEVAAQRVQDLIRQFQSLWVPWNATVEAAYQKSRLDSQLGVVPPEVRRTFFETVSFSFPEVDPTLASSAQELKRVMGALEEAGKNDLVTAVQKKAVADLLSKLPPTLDRRGYAQPLFGVLDPKNPAVVIWWSNPGDKKLQFELDHGVPTQNNYVKVTLMNVHFEDKEWKASMEGAVSVPPERVPTLFKDGTPSLDNSERPTGPTRLNLQTAPLAFFPFAMMLPAPYSHLVAALILGGTALSMAIAIRSNRQAIQPFREEPEMKPDVDVEYDLSEDVLDLWEKTVWGTPGQGASYTKSRQDYITAWDKLPKRFGNKSGRMVLTWRDVDGRLVGARIVSMKRATIDGKLTPVAYHGTTAIDDRYRGFKLGNKFWVKSRDKILEITDQKAIIYGLVEAENDRPKKASAHAGYSQVGRIAATFHLRLPGFPLIKDKRFRAARPADRETILRLLRDQYKVHAMTDFETSLDIDSYYVLEENGEIVAGVQVKEENWNVRGLGLPGERYYQPLLRLIFKPITLGNLYFKSGHAKDTAHVIKAALAEHDRYMGLLFLDPESRGVYQEMEEAGAFGIANKAETGVGLWAYFPKQLETYRDILSHSRIFSPMIDPLWLIPMLIPMAIWSWSLLHGQPVHIDWKKATLIPIFMGFLRDHITSLRAEAMDHYFEESALVIGGTNGSIGGAVANQLKAAGADVWIGSRSAEGPQTFTIDVTDNAQKIKETIDTMIHRMGVPDFIFITPGYARAWFGDQIPLDVAQEMKERGDMMETNYRGSEKVIDALLPYMKVAGRGHIVITSSMAAFLPVAGYRAYVASKAAVHNFGLALRNELAPYGIRVTVLAPPNTRTPGLTEENRTKPREVLAMEEKASTLSADEVASQLLVRLPDNPAVVIPGGSNRWIERAWRLAPGLIEKYALRRKDISLKEKTWLAQAS